MVIDEEFTLLNGNKIPALGFGTWQIRQEDAEQACLAALKAGYKHIDTAEAYNNEEGVGQAIKKSGLKREDIYLTSKVKAEIKTYEKAKAAIEESLRKLDTPYIDLMLIHAPRPWAEMPFALKRYFKENLEVWRAMEEAYKAGKLKAIGVSNFQVDDLQNIIDNSSTVPMVNHVRFFISQVPEDVLKFCLDKKIVVEGYSPIATGRLLKSKAIGKMAEKYSVSIPQLCIRYVYQRGALPLPKAVHEEHIIANTKIDFTISPEDMTALNKLKKQIIGAW